MAVSLTCGVDLRRVGGVLSGSCPPGSTRRRERGADSRRVGGVLSPGPARRWRALSTSRRRHRREGTEIGRVEITPSSGRGHDEGKRGTPQTNAHGVHDLVAVRRQAHHDAGTAERQDPQHDLGGHLLLRADLALLVREVGGREGAHGVRDVVGAVREPGWKSSSELGYRRCSTAWGARI